MSDQQDPQAQPALPGKGELLDRWEPKDQWGRLAKWVVQAWLAPSDHLEPKDLLVRLGLLVLLVGLVQLGLLVAILTLLLRSGPPDSSPAPPQVRLQLRPSAQLAVRPSDQGRVSLPRSQPISLGSMRSIPAQTGRKDG